MTKLAAAREVCAGQTYVQDGIGMYVDYRLDDRRDPTIEVWCFSTSDPDCGVDGYGRLEIRVSEIVQTESSGTLAVYHRQWFAPDGEPMARARRNMSSIGSLRALIRRRKMTPTSLRTTKDDL